MLATNISVIAALDDELESLVNQARSSLVGVECGPGQGSGIVWSADGLIVTNHHVAQSDRVLIYQPGSRSPEPGFVIARSPADDLALVQVEKGGLCPVKVRDDRELHVGDLVIAVGNPLAISGAATLGLVSASGARLRGFGRAMAERELLHVDITLAPGNSGGPMIDTRGRLVGVACMVVSPGIGIAVPSHVVERFVNRALSTMRRAA